MMGNVSKTALFVSTISRQHDVFMGSLYSVFCVLSLLGNGMLLFVAYRKRSSLKPAEFFVVNLSVSDLGMTLSVFPLAIPSALAHRYYPSHDVLAMSYIISLFIFCYVLPCTIIFLSYTFILLTVRRSRQAVKQHVSPQTKVTNAHTLIGKLSVAVCIGFLTAWSPYAVVAMWAAFSANEQVPPTSFALAAIFAKSSTLYNPMVYLLFKPNFRKSLSQDTRSIRHRICLSHSKASPTARTKGRQGQSSQTCNKKDATNSTPFSSSQPESYGACVHYADTQQPFQHPSTQTTVCVQEGTVQTEIIMRELTEKMHNDLL
ncbi:Red-sensitive opsin [Triplophysa tibetana]|uniref:Red-sensitive opsin n=1 Tax=Triplophysa tibetana TaxID=1572043 RepID=A0A5A9NUX5_9TELE|nr:Red-sensitive opsin [Triplophysa tibetana]